MDLNCLRCRTPLDSDCQLIYDEIGIELQLDKLLVEHFGIHIKKDTSANQALCEDCVNKLIELYDITQKNQESEATEPNPNDEEHTFEVLDIKEEEPIIIEEVDIDPENEDIEFETNCSESENYQNENHLSSVADEDEEFIGFDDDNCVILNEASLIDELEGLTTREYTLRAIKSELQEINYNQDTECRLCQELLKSHTAVIMHISTNHESESKTYPCIICNADNFESMKDLAYHIVIKHYNLECITIYCMCPECEKRFSNFIEYNKHSCYKAKTGNRLITECSPCSLKFSSNKRYRFHLQFHLPKKRPKACFICDILFSNEKDFFEHIMYAHESNDTLICKKCDIVCSTKKLYNSHMSLHTAIRTFFCDYCSKSYLYKQMLVNHVKRHHTDKDLFQCLVCKKSLATKHLLTRHMQLIHSKDTKENVYKCSQCGLVGACQEDVKEHIEEENCSEGKLAMECLPIAYACEFCENAYSSVDELKTHRTTHVKKVYTCWVCKVGYSEFKKIKTHILTHNKELLHKTFPINRHYVCDFDSCVQSYLTWPSLRAHKQRHAVDAKFRCEICNQTFRTISLLNNHGKGHENNEEFPCEFCSKMCTSQMSLAVHIARKHNNNSISCPICHTTYTNNETLKQHIDSYHVTNKCDQCGKVTKNKRNLETHIRMVHAKVKRFFCPTCNKGYYNNSDMKVHIKAAHANQHKFKCDHCAFTSSYETSYNAHLLLHASNKPFKCGECSREFTRKNCFKLHMLRHSAVKPFRCPVEDCDKSFITRGILNTHLRDSHAESKDVRAVKSPSPQLGKRKLQGVPKAARKSKLAKYIVIEENSVSEPVEVGDESSIILYDDSHTDQEMVLQYIQEENDLIKDENED